eukprot:378894-Pyramimonas_sp.AAC.1
MRQRGQQPGTGQPARQCTERRAAAAGDGGAAEPGPAAGQHEPARAAVGRHPGARGLHVGRLLSL